MPDSYMKFLADTLTGFDFNENLVDTLTTVCLALALAASIYTNVKDWKKNRGKETKQNHGKEELKKLMKWNTATMKLNMDLNFFLR